MASTRREFLGLGAAAAGLLAGCGGDLGSRRPAPALAEGAFPATVPPPIPEERYAGRRAALAARMRKEGLDLLLVTPGVSLTYLTGASLPKGERLIAWVLGEDGSSRCLGPASEEGRLACSGVPRDWRSWKETQDPIALLAEVLSSRGSSPRIAAEGTLGLDILAPLGRRLPGARIASATPLLSALRMRKEPEEIALIRAAADIALEAIRLDEASSVAHKALAGALWLLDWDVAGAERELERSVTLNPNDVDALIHRGIPGREDPVRARQRRAGRRTRERPAADLGCDSLRAGGRGARLPLRHQPRLRLR